MATNVYVKAPETAPLVDAVDRILSGSERRADPEGILGEPPPVTLSPSTGGWIAICGLRAWVSDLPWVAEELARDLGTTAVSSELLGNSYRLRLAVCDASGPRESAQHPDLPWGSAPEHEGEMPRYDDVEALAFRRLSKLGLPPPLVTLGVQPFALPAPARLPLGRGVRLSRDEGSGSFSRSEVELHSFAGRPDEPPVVPQELGQGFGIVIFEHRYVEGRPTTAAMSRLLELEDGFAARASRASGGARVNLTVTYHGGRFQEELDEELRARGRFVPPSARRPQTPWWQFWSHFGFSRRR